MDHYEETCLDLQGAGRRKERFQGVDLRIVAFLDRFSVLQFKFSNPFRGYRWVVCGSVSRAFA